MRKNNKRKGFTIVELVIVIAVIAVLAAVMIPTFSGVIGNANDAAAKADAKAVYTDYVADTAADGTTLDNFVIATKNGKDTVYYAVVDGSLKDTEYTTLDDAANTGVLNAWTETAEIVDADNSADGIQMIAGYNIYEVEVDE